MAVLKKIQKETINDHVENDIGVYLNVKMWLAKIHTVVNIDTNKTYKLDAECKLIYGYLFGFGKTQGWDNIYPNQDTMCEALGISTTSLKRKIKTLAECGLIDVIHTKNVSKFGSNRYRVKQPRYIDRRKWFDLNGVQLVGKLYKFDYNMYKKKGL